MPNAIALITKYLADAENTYAVFTASALTADLETPNTEFTGAKTIKVPVISFGSDAMGSYSRSTGFVQKDVTLSWEDYTLTQDTGDMLKMDAMDLEESGTSIITFYNAYNRRVMVPTVDKYRLSKLATTGTKTVTTALTASNIVDKLDAAFIGLRDNSIPTEGAILYLPYTAEPKLKNATGLTKFISEGNWNGQMASKVRMYDDAKIVYVPTNRWPSNTEFILVNPQAQVSTIKLSKCKLYTEVPGFDGPQIDVRLYHDCFVKEQRIKGVQVGLTAAETTTNND